MTRTTPATTKEITGNVFGIGFIKKGKILVSKDYDKLYGAFGMAWKAQIVSNNDYFITNKWIKDVESEILSA